MTGLAIAVGTTLGLGVFLVLVGAESRNVRLSDAFELLAGTSPQPTMELATTPSGGGLEAAGARVQRWLSLPVSPRQQRLLLLQGRSVGDFFAEKLVLAGLGLLLPVLWLAVQYALGQLPSPLPLAFGLVGAVLGYVAADWRLTASAARTRRAAKESIHTFFDLVMLERLANSSAAQAVAGAASVSTSPLFLRIRTALERARLEQVPPWRELTRIAQEWELPELADFADLMRLEEQGAALADALHARVRELREEHATNQKTAAQEQTEALTIWMTLPALILGLAFVIPPLLRLLAS